MKSITEHLNIAAVILDRLSDRERPSEKFMARILEEECPDWSRDEIASLMELCLFVARREQSVMMDRIAPFIGQSKLASRRHIRGMEALYDAGRRVFDDQRREAAERARAEMSARLKNVFGPALRGDVPDDEDLQ